ncbi:hypothetical protein TIFTF001_034640 [Ficus carica]|uniref:Uncharacterized protein n=1 Tax=Ficus carica TaxID=3494 RepID=A0AA88E0A0_FICCA|nr:hypothetical protein TIFTF001_034640 [Ficus carica]
METKRRREEKSEEMKKITTTEEELSVGQFTEGTKERREGPQGEKSGILSQELGKPKSPVRTDPEFSTPRIFSGNKQTVPQKDKTRSLAPLQRLAEERSKAAQKQYINQEYQKPITTTRNNDVRSKQPSNLRGSSMADNKSSSVVPPQYDVNAKWDACLDLSVRRFVYSSLAGAFGGLLLFREFLFPFIFLSLCLAAVKIFPNIWALVGSPVTRWASVAFGAGVGLGSAYTECSQLFGGSPAKLAVPQISKTPVSQFYLFL